MGLGEPGFVTRAPSLVNLVLWLPRVYPTMLAAASDYFLWILAPTLCGRCAGGKDSISGSKVNLMTRHKPVNEFHALATGIGSGIGTANQALSLTIYTRPSLFFTGLELERL